MSKIPQYRAWDKEELEMYEVEMIDFELEEVRYTENPSGYDVDALLEQVELLRSIRLKDINGKAIFQGDIVRWGLNGDGRVFEYGTFIYKNTEKHLEIVGNIYEMPDYLQKFGGAK